MIDAELRGLAEVHMLSKEGPTLHTLEGSLLG